MDASAQEVVSGAAYTPAQQRVDVQTEQSVRRPGTKTESLLESERLERQWQSRLSITGWSDRISSQIKFGYATSTLKTYNVYVLKYKNFCLSKNIVFPCTDPKIIGDFLCMIADSSKKPRSVLGVSSCALKALFRARGENVSQIFTDDITMLITALVKGGTTVPMSRTETMPIERFSSYFLSLPPNEMLSIKDLRQKTVCLLGLAVMLRPSDLAPKAVSYDPVTGVTSRVIFSTKNVRFNVDGSMNLTLFGIKNDYYRKGFEVMVPPHKNKCLDPVCALRCYISKTRLLRNVETSPVFISLNRPFHVLTETSIANIMKECIEKVGLDSTKFTAKYFRPTGATAGIEAGHDPEIIRKLGRWNSSNVFYEHYVHCKTPSALIESILPE